MSKEIDLNKYSGYKAVPKWSIAARIPQREMAKGMPGPGNYAQTHTEKDKFQTTPKFTMASGNRDSKEWGSFPGPGQYAPINNSKGPPKWGFGSETRLHEPKQNRGPGPGAYETRGGLDGLHFSVSSRPGGMSKTSQTPAPGHYKADNYSSTSMYESSPKISFGSSSRGELAASKTPGPGAYEALNILGGNCSMRAPPRFTILGKRNQMATDQSPGPGPTTTQFAR